MGSVGICGANFLPDNKYLSPLKFSASISKVETLEEIEKRLNKEIIESSGRTFSIQASLYGIVERETIEYKSLEVAPEYIFEISDETKRHVPVVLRKSLLSRKCGPPPKENQVIRIQNATVSFKEKLGKRQLVLKARSHVTYALFGSAEAAFLTEIVYDCHVHVKLEINPESDVQRIMQLLQKRPTQNTASETKRIKLGLPNVNVEDDIAVDVNVCSATLTRFCDLSNNSNCNLTILAKIVSVILEKDDQCMKLIVEDAELTRPPIKFYRKLPNPFQNSSESLVMIEITHPDVFYRTKHFKEATEQMGNGILRSIENVRILGSDSNFILQVDGRSCVIRKLNLEEEQALGFNDGSQF